jgi:hypothetical protein
MGFSAPFFTELGSSSTALRGVQNAEFHPRLSGVENVGVNSFALSHRDIPDETDACTAKFCKDFLYRWV